MVAGLVCTNLEQRKLLWTLNSLVSQRRVKSAVSSSSMMALLTEEIVASLPRDLGTKSFWLGLLLNRNINTKAKKQKDTDDNINT